MFTFSLRSNIKIYMVILSWNFLRSGTCKGGESMNKKLYLDISSSDEETAKKLGAKFDKRRKLWYTDADPEKYINFAKWIIREKKDVTTIVCDYIYIIQGTKTCKNCNQETGIIGLGIEKFVEIFAIYGDDEKTKPVYINEMSGFDGEQNMYITWIENEKEIPQFMLKYLKENYPVKTGISEISGKVFANHCEHCGALLEKDEVFGEPFMLSDDDFEKNIKKAKEFKIKRVPLKENIRLDCEYSASVNETDDMYLTYGDIEDITL